MSWDIFVQDFPRDAKSVAEIPADYRPKALGLRAELIEKICRLVPATDFHDPTWGVIEGDTFSIEISMGSADIVESFAFHVRGGEGAVGLIAAILSHLDLRAIDAQSGEFFEWGQSALDSFRRWRAFRDQVVKDVTKH
jgi:hypothetical protein